MVAFAIEGVHPHDIASILDSEGICHPRRAPLLPAPDAPPDVPALARASFYIYTTEADVDALVRA